MIMLHGNIHAPVYVLVHIEALLTYRKERINLNEKRRDSKNRLLRTGESQRPNGSYMYRYTDMNGNRKTIYSWRLVGTDLLCRMAKRIKVP